MQALNLACAKSHRKSRLFAARSEIVSAFEKGIELEKQGQFDQALPAFEEATKGQPRFDAAWIHLGAMLTLCGRAQDSIAAFNRALQINGQNAYAWEGRGRAQNLLGNYRAGLADSEQALKLNPNLPEAHYDRGRALFAFDDKRSLQEAIKEFDRTLAINPNHVDALSFKAGALVIQGKFDQAIPPALRAVSMDPRQDKSWRALAMSYWERRDFTRALDAVNQALALDPQDVGAWTLKGGILRNRVAFNRSLADLDDALAAFDQALALDPGNYEATQAKRESSDVRKRLMRGRQFHKGVAAVIRERQRHSIGIFTPRERAVSMASG
jgi:tetratricopeptide (TPR) repeat protein